jgi:hypothetical protein
MVFILEVVLEKRDLAWSIADFTGFKDTQVYDSTGYDSIIYRYAGVVYL